MNIDWYFTNQKPQKLQEQEKDKLLEIIFGKEGKSAKKIEDYIGKNEKEIFGEYKKYIRDYFVKNQTLYVEVMNKIVFQELLFRFHIIKQKIFFKTGETLKAIREIPLKKKKYYAFQKNKELDVFNVSNKKKIPVKKNTNQSNYTLIKEIKFLLNKKT